MKTRSWIFLLFCLTSTICQAQFPAPLQFKMSYIYITLDDYGPCCGIMVLGPTYCTKFQWETPNLSETEAKLIGYNIYYLDIRHYYEGMEIPFSEGTIIAQTTDNFVEKEIGIIGVVWVTAVYSDPEGESAPSNIQFNNDLPTSIKKVEKEPISLTYNAQKNGIEIEGIENIASFNIFRLDGVIITSISLPDTNFIDTKDIAKGVYIVRITTKEAKVFTKTIVIK